MKREEEEEMNGEGPGDVGGRGEGFGKGVSSNPFLPICTQKIEPQNHENNGYSQLQVAVTAKKMNSQPEGAISSTGTGID